MCILYIIHRGCIAQIIPIALGHGLRPKAYASSQNGSGMIFFYVAVVSGAGPTVQPMGRRQSVHAYVV